MDVGVRKLSTVVFHIAQGILISIDKHKIEVIQHHFTANVQLLHCKKIIINFKNFLIVVTPVALPQADSIGLVHWMCSLV